MIYQITIEEKARDNLKYFKKHNKQLFTKIENLILNLAKDSFGGIGKPEPLKFELSGYWSKRITKEHRLIYKIEDQHIIVLSCRYHY